jgi:hypothetical protein
MPKRYVVEFTVRGPVGQSFPIDMLRYDQCWPARQEDAESIAVGAVREVRLRTITVNPEGCVTRDRWASFGFNVVGDVNKWEASK